ncbi:LodA/GoxA family CTQ-dependent oxidase [Streptomyces noursei]|uniref:LodA/GoxA family CTQ-dependent oxidase n=1 Tax=Streptomyces noursei TaxID=1971 RepID=UPI0019655755|nr:LodA/GoxA family CTQ-dependent oxidase [Streptomyces noursei]QRX96688.1 LodA/GoxA family CTQ-dependent oxidase [Streptomyces noursei]
MDQEIVRVKIHPAIGVARVGNSISEDGYFIGPESPDQEPQPPGFYKDAVGAIKRQAARFRIYGYDKNGQVVRELKLDDQDVTEIAWTVHLANKKAAWYQFHLALDIPEARRLKPEQYALRNFDVKNENRHKLVIDPGPRTVLASRPATEKFDTGQIMDRTVYLGEIFTQGDGRLLVLGGRGASASYENRPVDTFANNDTWYDDISDGPVTATVTIGGREMAADPAWIVVGPPDYAPGVKTVRTLYDLLEDVFIRAGWLPRPQQISFTDDIEPILRRFCELQWVNRGFATQYGWKGPHFFLAPEMLARLADNSERNRELRRQVYTALRDYDRDGPSPRPWPWIYGDAMTVPAQSDLQHMVLSPTQQEKLERWADGRFISVNRRARHADVDQARVAEQPNMLDRAALEYCLADAFHPGCEITWPIRHDTMYAEPFRILHRGTEPEPYYGESLTPDEALSKRGPLYGQGPGDLTRWMAVPWQTDTASCRSGYEVVADLGPRYSPYLPAFWPAQVPNQVLTEDDFTIVNTAPDSSGTARADADLERATAFEHRAVWLRGLKGEKEHQLQQMITDWSKLGIVEVRDYTVGDGKFPERMLVESRPGAPLDRAPSDRNLVNLHVPQANPQAPMAEARHVIDRAVAHAEQVTPYKGEEISAGYIEKVDPFRTAQ